MKKLMLLLVAAFLVAGTQAQTKEEIEKRKAAKAEQVKLSADQAALDKEQAILAEKARLEKIKMFKDSVEADTRAQWVKDSLRSIQDSSNKVQAENEKLTQEKYLSVDKSRNDVYGAAGLSDYKKKKVKTIKHFFDAKKEQTERGSNQRPQGCERSALTRCPRDKCSLCFGELEGVADQSSRGIQEEADKGQSGTCGSRET